MRSLGSVRFDVPDQSTIASTTEEAEEARLHSAQTGSLLPFCAVGKVPVPLGRECRWETKTPWPHCGSEAEGGAGTGGSGNLSQHSHAVSCPRKGAN